MADGRNMSEPHPAPSKTLVDKVIELALSAGGGAVTLMSGLLAAMLILYSTYVLYDTYSIERAASSNAWELLEMRPDILDDPEAPFDSTQLEEINKDYVCWLTVFGTPIDYPVVQGPNDTYYAAVDIYGQPSLTGAIYLATGNSRDLSDSYNMIFGHHMDSGAMFGGLDDMTGDETGVMVTGDAIYDVQFFAVVNTDAYEDRIYDVGNRKDDVLDFLRSGGEGGVGIGTEVVYFNEEAAEDAEKLVALSTCANANTSGRLVVIGKMTKRIIMKDITVTKVWDDNNNQDGIRPDSVILTASDGTQAELTAEGDWTATVSVPKFDNLGEVQYTWDEVSVNGYSMLSNVTEGDSTIITNKHVPAVKSLTVIKVWDDDGNRDGIRPASVAAILSDGQRVTLDESNTWTATIDDLPVYANGEEIVYSWTEETPDGYTLSAETDGDITTLTNTHTPETKDLVVNKVWDDNNNQDGIRPDHIDVSLYGNEEFIGELTLDLNGEWSGTIAGQFVYENGEEIEYVWEEDQITGYSLSSSVDGAVTTLTNMHVPATKDLTVKKVWDDNHDQDGVRPRSLHLLLNSDRSVTLTSAEDWTATVTGLPVYANGVEIVYTWTEENISGYTLNSTVVNGNTTILTNRHETATTVATVTKDWEDDNNRDGIRPETLTATLSDGQSVTLSDENNWTRTIEGLPANAAGVPIVYTWTEEDVDGYTSSSTVAGTSTEFINTHAIATTSQSVNKVWDDNDNQDGIRPTEVVVHLNSNGTPIKTLTLKASEDWSAQVDDLPVNENGQPIVYTWTEQSITGYTHEIVTEETVTTITNTHTPEVKDLTVSKVWDDANDQDGIRPDKLIVTLSDGQAVELTEDNGWTDTLRDLPVYSSGTLIAYSWTEESIDGYTLTDTAVNGNHTTLTNTHVPATKELSIRKIWDDDNDRDRLRPSTLSIRLMAGDTAVHTVSLNNANDWSATVPDMPVNAAGQPIVYSWEEDSIAGYELSSEEDGSLTIFTNKHVPASKELTVNKVWDDDNDRDGLRPETLTVILYADQLEYDTKTLEDANEWTATLTVPVYDKGIKVHYEWKEPMLSGYSESVEVNGNNTTFTNKHVPATTSREIRKVWDDSDDQDGLRPESLTIYLEADRQVIRTITLDEAHGWAHTADNLFVFSTGTPISYSWSEEILTDYPDKNAVSSGTLTTITNTHVPATETLTVTKVWDDNNDQDGIRPESLEVSLLANGEKVGAVTLDADKGWSDSIDDLPVNAGGKPIAYAWDEGDVEGYTLDTVTNGTSTILTNTHITEKTVATVTKVWDDDNDRDGVRPESLTMTLSNGDTAELNADNNWTATIEGLDRFSEGEEIVYTWTEDSIKGYTQVSNVTDGTVTTVTNHHDIAKTSKTVIKIWEDNDDRSGARPESITVWLNKTQKVILNAENNWSATIKDLPVYRNGGHAIIYKWTEDDVIGYTLTSKVTTGNTTELTNTLDELEKEYTLTIIYRYPDSSEAAPTYTGTYVAGDGYAVWSPNIDGYVAVPLQVAGTMPEGDLTVIVTYMPAGRGVPVGRAPIGGSVGDCIE